MRVTHPFHPLADREFDFAFRRKTWGEDRVFFFDEEGKVRGVPARWTNVASADPFTVVSAGRAAFRVEDLLALVCLVETLNQSSNT